MLKTCLAIVLGTLTVVAAAQTHPTAKPHKNVGTPQKKTTPAQPELKSDADRRSYALGMDLGHQFSTMGISVDPAIFERGMKASLTGGKTELTQEEMKEALTKLQAELKQKQMAAREAAIQQAKEAGTAFLAANKTKEGVVTLPSGLQYKILKEGTGPRPTLTDTVVCNYRGTLVNGTEFDSSYKRGQPATFPLNKVIKGWTEALQLMPVGSKWELYIPPDLAYGDRGAGDVIPPDSTLIFEVELMSIQQPQTEPTQEQPKP
jgi:FKBP-type peptidyl-prolyl cis-trans isomerase FklB